MIDARINRHDLKENVFLNINKVESMKIIPKPCFKPTEE